MDMEWTFPYPEDTFQGQNFDPNPLVIAIWLGDAIVGMIFPGMFKNRESETVFGHVFKFLKKGHRQIGGIKV